MPANAVVRARVDEDVKDEAAAVLAGMGLTVSDAVRMMLIRVAKEKQLPFSPLVPNEETISNLSYPGSRKLYIYVKGEHMAAKPTIKGFIEAYAKAWGKGGSLEKRGLVPFAGADASAATEQATALKPLDPASLK